MTCLSGLAPLLYNRKLFAPQLTPIPKKGKDPTIPLNNRTISLISTVAKGFSSLLNNRMLEYLEFNNLLVDEQNGFRKLRSCLDHLYVLTTAIQHRKTQKLPTFACYVDFSKAFDAVNHDCLWYKMLKIGITGKMYNIMQTLYKDIKSSVRINGYLTDWFSVTSGVRQGDNVAPTLFAIYVNDLIEEIKELNQGINIGNEMISALLYADDIVLLAETEEGLQKQLKHLHGWCMKWRINVNMDKTKIMHFRQPAKEESSFKFMFGDDIVKYTDSYRYLGFDLHYTLNHEHGVNILGDAAGRALGMLISKYFKLQGLTYDTYTRIYNNTVVPVCDYGSGIWGTKSYNKCHTLQNRTMRTFLGVGKVTPIPFLYGEMNWLPPNIRQQGEVIRLWTRLINMDESRLTRKVFEVDHQLAMNGQTCWSSSVCSILTAAGFNNIFQQKSLLGHNKKHIIEAVMKSQWLEYQESWIQNIKSFSRLSNYTKYKKCIVLEKYVSSKILTRWERQNLAKLRSGTLPIEIEKGRYRQKPREERKCNQCTINVVETEEHFLLKCPGQYKIINNFKQELRNTLMLTSQDDIDFLKVCDDIRCSKVVSNHITTLISNRKIN